MIGCMPGLRQLFREFERAEQVVRVGDRQRRHGVGLGELGQRLDAERALAQRDRRCGRGRCTKPTDLMSDDSMPATFASRGRRVEGSLWTALALSSAKGHARGAKAGANGQRNGYRLQSHSRESAPAAIWLAGNSPASRRVLRATAAPTRLSAPRPLRPAAHTSALGTTSPPAFSAAPGARPARRSGQRARSRRSTDSVGSARRARSTPARSPRVVERALDHDTQPPRSSKSAAASSSGLCASSCGETPEKARISRSAASRQRAVVGEMVQPRENLRHQADARRRRAVVAMRGRTEGASAASTAVR